MLLVAPFRPLWWAGRRVLRLVTCAVLATALWAGLQAATGPEPSRISFASVSSAVGTKSMTQFVVATHGPAWPVAERLVPAAPLLAASLQGRLPDGPGRHRAPPRR